MDAQIFSYQRSGKGLINILNINYVFNKRGWNEIVARGLAGLLYLGLSVSGDILLMSRGCRADFITGELGAE